MEELLISVIVPVFNAERCVGDTLESILAQTYPNIEIIAVDDGSADGSAAVLDAYAGRFPRLRVIRTPNRGVSAARMTGVRNAHGDCIAFVDADDLIDPDMYERLMRNMVRYGADVSHCGQKLIRPDGIQYFYNTGKLVIQDKQKGITDLLEGKQIEPGLCNKLFRRRLFDQMDRCQKMDWTLKNNEDLLMNYLLFSFAEKSVYEDFCPYRYIVRENSASKGRMDVHKLADPIKAAGTIYRNLKGNRAGRSAAAGLYAVKLIRGATFYGAPAASDLAAARKAALKELRRFSPKFLADPRQGIKRKGLLLFAACCPRGYWRVHQRYLDHADRSSDN